MNSLPETSQGPCYMSANSKGSGETALMRRLARAFAGHLFDKYPFPKAGSFIDHGCNNLIFVKNVG